MDTTRRILDHETYEYKEIAVQPTRYEARESMVRGHRFKYTKRRMWIMHAKWTGFNPACSCKWRSTIWHPTKALAMAEHYQHGAVSQQDNPRLEGV